VSLKRVLIFAGLFLLIQIVSTLSDRYLGRIGFLGISVLGGLVSGASTSAAAANMVGHGEMRAALAGYGVVLASVASALVNLPIIHGCAKPRWSCFSGPRATLWASTLLVPPEPPPCGLLFSKNSAPALRLRSTISAFDYPTCEFDLSSVLCLSRSELVDRR
jgi:Domain of unknown function (DUF4010)